MMYIYKELPNINLWDKISHGTQHCWRKFQNVYASEQQELTCKPDRNCPSPSSSYSVLRPNSLSSCWWCTGLSTATVMWMAVCGLQSHVDSVKAQCGWTRRLLSPILLSCVAKEVPMWGQWAPDHYQRSSTFKLTICSWKSNLWVAIPMHDAN